MREAQSAYIERQLRALVPTLLAVNRRAGSSDAELSEHIVRLVMLFLPPNPKRPPTVSRPGKGHVRWADIRDGRVARAQGGDAGEADTCG